MALGILSIFFGVLVVVAIVLQFLLYKNKEGSKSNNIIFIINMIFVIFLSYIAYTALPINFTGQKIIALVWSIIAIIGIIVKLKTKQAEMVSKLILTVATVGALVQNLFV